MKGGTVQITWHGSDPVLSLDFHRLSGLLATGGADHDIKFWTLREAANALLPSATFHSSLSYHTAAVNVVRFSAAGDQLASGADGGEIILWRLTENPEASSMWKLAKNLRFHVKDVLDLQWSSDGTLLVSGSVDNTVIIWDIVKGNPQQVLNDHMHYVQGVAWDPIGQYIASISGDRTCRIYCNKPQNPKGKSQDRHNFSCQSVLVKTEVPKQEDEANKVAATKLNLFHDETLPSFFRRLAWSPDGSFLLVPAGIHKLPSQSDLTNTAFIISRQDLSRPAVQLPGASKPVVAVRFCPVMFSCHPNIEQNMDKDSNDTAVFKLPYKLVFAVASLNSLFVYDTQSSHPIAVLAGIHYAAITDIAWSCDGKFLAVSSQDGFCTLVAFDQEELGSPLPLSELPSYIAKFLPPAKDKVGHQDHQAKASSVNSGNSGTPLQQNQEANASSGFVMRASATRIEQPRESQHASVNNGTPPEKIQEANASSGSSPKKPRRITPVAVSLAPSQQGHQENASSGNSGTPLQQNHEANASSGFVMQDSATQIDLLLESQRAGCIDATNSKDKDHMLSGSPKKPKRITPVAVSCAPSPQDHPANASSMKSGSSGTPLQQNQEANAFSGIIKQASATQIEPLQESQRAACIGVANSKDHALPGSPKKPRRITPVAIACAPSQQDHQANASSMNSGNSGLPLQQNQEANASSGFVMQASATQSDPLRESRRAGCIDVTNSKDLMLSGTDKIKNLQSSPKRPRRITPVAMDMSCTTQQIATPVAMDVSCTTQQIADASRDDNK